MFPGRVVTFVQRKEKRPVHGYHSSRQPYIQRSGRTPVLPYPPLRLKHYYNTILLSFVNVQPHRSGGSICCDEGVQQLGGYVFGRFSFFYLLRTFLQFSLVSIQFGLPTKRQNDVCLYVIPPIFPNALIWH